MRITNKNGTVIQDIKSWEDAFKEVDYEKHWKEGRSAMLLARYFSSPNIEQSYGIELIKEYVDKCGFKNFEPIRARIEHESRFDEFCGKGRMHDMVIWGNGGERHLVICIEAKVDEPFGSLVSEAYCESLKYVEKNRRSKRAKRIEKLCDKYYKNVKDIVDDTDIRYQLLHYYAGSITEAKSCNDVVLMPIMVFETEESNKYNDNKKDFDAFVNAMNFKLFDSEKLIYKKKIDGADVYMTYIEITK